MSSVDSFQVLIVDDEKVNVELAGIYLKEDGYRVLFALSAQAALETISKKSIDLILLDINMPQVDGFELSRMLKEDKKSKNIPIVFLTAQTDMKYVSKAFEVGGVDYLSKPFNPIELKARVKTHLQTVSYINEIKEKQSKLAQISITDALTKLHNSFYFNSQINILSSSNENFWFLYIKIDRFDKINKIYGFNGGDKILKNFSELLKEKSYSNSVIARLYGASFGILMKDYEMGKVKELYEQLHAEHLKEQSKIYTFSTVMYSVKNQGVSIKKIYKNVQENMQKIESSGEKYLFV